MLKGKLIHPQILETLGRAGHGSQVLIADGNYPFASKLGPNARLVNLNLSPGLVTCPQVLEALVTAMPIEAAYVMQYATTGPHALKADPPVWNEFRQILHGRGCRWAPPTLRRNSTRHIPPPGDNASSLSCRARGTRTGKGWDAARGDRQDAPFGSRP